MARVTNLCVADGLLYHIGEPTSTATGQRLHLPPTGLPSVQQDQGRRVRSWNLLAPIVVLVWSSLQATWEDDPFVSRVESGTSLAAQVERNAVMCGNKGVCFITSWSVGPFKWRSHAFQFHEQPPRGDTCQHGRIPNTSVPCPPVPSCKRHRPSWTLFAVPSDATAHRRVTSTAS